MALISRQRVRLLFFFVGRCLGVQGERECVSFPRVCTPLRSLLKCSHFRAQANGLNYCPLFRAFATQSYAPFPPWTRGRFPASSHLSITLFFAPFHSPCHSLGKFSRAQPQLPQRPAHGGAACRQVPALQCVPLPRSHAAACNHCLGMPQPCIVCHMHTSRLRSNQCLRLFNALQVIHLALG